MPDFHLPERVTTLVFEDGDLKGLELQVRLSLPFDAMFKMQSLMTQATEGSDLGGLNELLHYFAEHALVGWNLSNGAGPVELTPAALTAHLDAPNAGRLLSRYLQEVGRVPDSLAPRSANGSTSKVRKVSKSRTS